MKNQLNHHHFHIPVMGLAFTIDTPIKVAHYGISSVISIVQDNLIEKMREHYYKLSGEVFVPIKAGEPDYRVRRISDYLDLIDRLVQKRLEKLRCSPFGEKSEIDQYFEMLPDDSPVKQLYDQMNGMEEGKDKNDLQNILRKEIRAGSIDVNIMTKLDKNVYDSSGEEIEDGSDAVTALRGYAQSKLSNSTIVLSAGINPRLFAYMEKLEAFNQDASGDYSKKIAIKVSDYRSALIQGKMLAKKGLWVSEFRIESGLNCGGHAFATDGFLLGPILEEFKSNRQELKNTLHGMYSEAMAAKGKVICDPFPDIQITVQGGIGTNEERMFLSKSYEVDSTGWGTPFLLVPEATTVDEVTIKALSKAGEKDVRLSHNSPLGVRFHYLNGSSAEQEKLERIKEGKPGIPCTEKYLLSNTEFGDKPICTASYTYQKKKLKALKAENLAEEEYREQKQKVLDKECLCVGLSNAAVLEYNLEPFKNRKATNICPGPNIAYFSEIVSLKTMVDHIYGRSNLLKGSRPHMFLKELSLYIDYWKEMIENRKNLSDPRQRKSVDKFYNNLMTGIQYYQGLSEKLGNEFSQMLRDVENRLDKLSKGLDHMAELKLK